MLLFSTYDSIHECIFHRKIKVSGKIKYLVFSFGGESISSGKQVLDQYDKNAH